MIISIIIYDIVTIICNVFTIKCDVSTIKCEVLPIRGTLPTQKNVGIVEFC